MPLSALIHGLLLFALTLGFTLAGTFKTVSETGRYVPSAPISVPYFLAMFLIATLILLAALRFTKRGEVFEALFTLAMLSGAWFLADIWFPGPAALLIGSAVIVGRVAWKRVGWTNLSMVLGIAGVVVSVAPSLSAAGAAVILTVLAFYDIVAVYATKHMVRLFKDLTARGAVFAFLLTPLTAKDLLRPVKEAINENRAMFLGTGDVALPAILTAAAARVRTAHGVAAALGAMAGFAVMYALFFHQGRRRPMPALPPIALGSIIGYLISLAAFP